MTSIGGGGIEYNFIEESHSHSPPPPHRKRKISKGRNEESLHSSHGRRDDLCEYMEVGKEQSEIREELIVQFGCNLVF